jgi:hypothetical protein
MGEIKHSSPNCACGFNTAGDQYTDPTCDPTAPPEGRVVPAPRPERPQVRLFLGDGAAASVEVNGVNVANAVMSLDLHAQPLDRELTLHVRVDEVVVDGESAVVVPQETHDALVALGWTPPEEA